MGKIKILIATVMYAVAVTWVIGAPYSLPEHCHDDSFSPSERPPTEIAAKAAFSAIRICEGSQMDYSTLVYSPSSDHLITAWPLSQVIEAAMLTIDVTDGASQRAAERFHLRMLSALDQYWDDSEYPPAYRPLAGKGEGRGHRFYDDNVWIALNFLRMYERSEDRQWLDKTEQIWEFLRTGSDGTESMPSPGGILWTRDPDQHYRSAVSTAGVINVALRLHQETQQQQYLDFAMEQLQWINNVLRAPDGMYFDGIRPDGYVEPAKWAYNQGLMISSYLLLHETTGEEQYLQEAQKIAEASIREYSQSDAHRWAQGPDFTAIFYRALLDLNEVAPNDSYLKEMNAYANLLWQNTNPATGELFYEETRHDYLLYQAGSAQILALLLTAESV